MPPPWPYRAHVGKLVVREPAVDQKRVEGFGFHKSCAPSAPRTQRQFQRGVRARRPCSSLPPQSRCCHRHFPGALSAAIRVRTSLLVTVFRSSRSRKRNLALALHNWPRDGDSIPTASITVTYSGAGCARLIAGASRRHRCRRGCHGGRHLLHDALDNSRPGGARLFGPRPSAW